VSQACVIACVGILTVTTVHMHRKGRHPRAREPGHSLSLEELASGAHAGLCFGLSASSCRTGFMLAKLAGVRPPYPATPTLATCWSLSSYAQVNERLTALGRCRAHRRRWWPDWG